MGERLREFQVIGEVGHACRVGLVGRLKLARALAEHGEKST